MATYDFDEGRGKRLKDARLAIRPKLSQQRLADLIGSHRVSITNWEKGEEISDDRLDALSGVLRRDKEWFIYGDKGPSLPSSTVEAISASVRTATRILLSYEIDIDSDAGQQFLSAVIRQASETGALSDVALRGWVAALVRQQGSDK